MNWKNIFINLGIGLAVTWIVLCGAVVMVWSFS